MQYLLFLSLIFFFIMFKKKNNEKPMDLIGFVFDNYIEKTFDYDSEGSDNEFLDGIDILAVICSESGGELLKGKKNNEIVGDNNKSFGIMQVSQPALTDVNRSLGTNYSIDDLRNDEKINLLVGSHYLNLCKKSSIGSPDPVWLAFKKYNGGIDETWGSKNDMASNYADKTKNYYNQLKNYRENYG